MPKDKNERRVPKLRFKGFTDDWMQYQLDDIATVNSGKDYKHLQKGNIPVYGTGGYMTSVNEPLSCANAVGIGRKGTINSPQLLTAPFWTVDTLFYIIPKEHLDLNFFYYLTQTINWLRYDESSGVPSLSKKTIEKIKLRLPELGEQIIIGDILSNLEKIITLEQEKRQKLIELSKYINYLLTTPKVLSNRFNIKTTEIKLKEVAPVTGGYAFKSEDYAKGLVPIIRIANISINGKVEGPFVSYKKESSLEKYLGYQGQNVIAMSGATTGKTSIIQKTSYINQRVGIFNTLDSFTNEYINMVINSLHFKKYIYSTMGVGAQPNISTNDINNYEFNIPIDSHNSKKLGLTYKIIKDNINLLEKKIYIRKRLKIVLLNSLFI